MLASLDNDSDNSDQESVSGAARARLMKTLNKPKVSNSNSDKENTRQDTSMADDDSEEEDETVRPRGRIAGAMRAQARSNNNSERKSTPLRKTSELGSGSEESDFPVISRKRKVRVSRHSTPEPILQDEPESPGMFVSPNAPATAAPADGSGGGAAAYRLGDG